VGGYSVTRWMSCSMYHLDARLSWTALGVFFELLILGFTTPILDHALSNHIWCCHESGTKYCRIKDVSGFTSTPPKYLHSVLSA
jgi:hypothetical protein